jgi:mono/diheme cytochrome c family protein
MISGIHVVAALALLASPAVRPRAPGDRAPASAPSRPRDRGEALFLEKCASCHDARGEKPLEGGPPLSARKLSAEVIDRNVKSRLPGAPPEDHRAVSRYIASLLRP